MVFDLTSYVDPGVYQQELLVPGGLNINGLPIAVTLIGTGSRNKRVTNEILQRGAVLAETLSPAALSPHIATLTNRGDRRIGNTQITRYVAGIGTVVPDGLVSYKAASISGTAAGPFNLSANKAFGLDLDGNDPITLVMHDVPVAVTNNVVITKVGNVVTVTKVASNFYTNGVRPGHLVTLATSEDAGNDGTFTVTASSDNAVSFTNAAGVANADDDTTSVTFSGIAIAGQEVQIFYNFVDPINATRAEVTAAVNSGLVAAASLGFGAAYSTVASDITTGIKLTSPISTPFSDVRVFAAPATNATSVLFGSAFLNAATVVEVAAGAYVSGATWKIDYVAASDTVLYPVAAVVQDNLDALANANIQGVISVGSFAGVGNFSPTVSWQLSGTDIDWSINTAASYVDGPAAVSFNLTSGSAFQLSVDGQAAVTIDVVNQANPPIGYVTGLVIGAVAPTDIVTNINAVLAQAYGPRYANVASTASNKILLTSPSKGAPSHLLITPPSSNNGATTLFGISAATDRLGLGQRPAEGATYYVTYDFTRPASDYNKPFLFFDPTTAKAQVGQVSVNTFLYNPLAKAIEVAFKNGSALVYIIQINDSSAPGTPTRNEVDTALMAAETLEEMTEIIVVDQPGTNLAVTTDVVQHVEIQSSPTEKHYRRGWFGMPVNTAPGDVDTAGTFVFEAANTLQVAPTSPGRGRYFLVTPPQQAGVSWDFTLEDGSTARVGLDSTYLSVATAALRSSLLSPSDTLTNRTLNGFNIDDVTQPWRRQERAAMASHGCLVVTLEGGRFIIKDPVTTEAGGAGKLSFKQDSASYQKDNITRKVNIALDKNIVGIVPFDLANFMIDIKLIIAGVLSNEISAGAIGPYRSESGSVRAIDPRVDIRVSQSTTDATKFFFGYWFNLRYPALRLFGESSVDNPFASLQVAA